MPDAGGLFFVLGLQRFTTAIGEANNTRDDLEGSAEYRLVSESELIWIYVTCRDAAQAEDIAKGLVDKRLAACVNILGPIRSIYRWEGKRCDEKEVALVAKTRRDLSEQSTAFIRSIHSYKVPCIVAIPLEGGNPDFLAWIRSETEFPR